VLFEADVSIDDEDGWACPGRGGSGWEASYMVAINTVRHKTLRITGPIVVKRDIGLPTNLSKDY